MLNSFYVNHTQLNDNTHNEFGLNRRGAMYRWYWGMFLIFLIAMPHISSADVTDSADNLANKCSAVLKINSGSQFTEKDATNWQYCVGYMDAFEQSNALLRTLYSEGMLDKKFKWFFCPPKTHSRGQSAKVFLKFTDAHPELLHKPSNAVYLKSLRDAWPCP